MMTFISSFPQPPKTTTTTMTTTTTIMTPFANRSLPFTAVHHLLYPPPPPPPPPPSPSPTPTPTLSMMTLTTKMLPPHPLNGLSCQHVISSDSSVHALTYNVLCCTTHDGRAFVKSRGCDVLCGRASCWRSSMM